MFLGCARLSVSVSGLCLTLYECFGVVPDSLLVFLGCAYLTISFSGLCQTLGECFWVVPDSL